MTACSSEQGPNSCRPTSSRTAIRPPCSGFPTCIASSDETTDEILCQRLARDRAPPTRHPCTALGHGRHSGRLGQRDPLSGDHRTQDGRGPMQCTGDERSEEHTSELQSQSNLVCRLLLEKKTITPNFLTLSQLLSRTLRTTRDAGIAAARAIGRINRRLTRSSAVIVAVCGVT